MAEQVYLTGGVFVHNLWEEFMSRDGWASPEALGYMSNRNSKKKNWQTREPKKRELGRQQIVRQSIIRSYEPTTSFFQVHPWRFSKKKNP